MKERPILFSAPMVRAILEGRKTQTRRLAKHLPAYKKIRPGARYEAIVSGCPYGAPGDRLWVRETHAQFAVGNRSGTAPQCVAFRATCDEGGSFDYVNNGDEIMSLKVTKWTPAIHMPRWASRITLEVTEVRVQRLQEITGEDAAAEGISVARCGCEVCSRSSAMCPADASVHVEEYAHLWDSINSKRAAWSSNPWVWAISFRRLP